MIDDRIYGIALILLGLCLIYYGVKWKGLIGVPGGNLQKIRLIGAGFIAIGAGIAMLIVSK